MKTILVAIDFSKNAEHALEYALTYAQTLNATVHLVWVDNFISDASSFDTIKGDVRIEKKEFLKNLTEKYRSKVTNGNIEIVLRKGKVYQEIAKVAKQINADMIFAGTHGVSGYEQHWIGSNAYRIVSQAPCPVFTIRSDYKFAKSINKILLPLDSSLETKEKLPFVISLAQKYNATIYLLKVYNTPIKLIRKRIDSFSDEAIKCLKDHGVNFILDSIEVKNVTASIIEYSNKTDIDLITIMTDQGAMSTNKFLGPYAQELINNSVIPVVSVRAKEND